MPDSAPEPPNVPTSIAFHFAAVEDPRIERTKRHLLSDVLTIALCAVLCGADDFVEIALFGRIKHAWLKERLPLAGGIPSHDTFTRVFARLDPDAFQKAFLSWIEAVQSTLAQQAPDAGRPREQLAIDGKALRRSFDHAHGRGAIHMVSAWAQAAGLVLGQRKVDLKSNEITAIAPLLEQLDVAGCIVSMDAMHCHKPTARALRDKDADYLLGLKANQGTLHEDVRSFFQDAMEHDFKDTAYARAETIEKDHGRIETRRCYTVPVEPYFDWLDPKREWLDLKTIVLIEAERRIGDNTTRERRLYITSLTGKTQTDARRILRAVRRHWSIENSLHWVLDIAFREDECRLHTGNAPENFALLRRIALNLLKKDTTTKAGIKARRRRAGWDEAFLANVIAGRND